MNIDTDHLHYWFQAIRNSDDKTRTLDAFWQGQIKSKEWLIDKLMPYASCPVSIDIYGGWVGTLASMIFQSTIPAINIRSIDIDLSCKPIASMMNKGEEIAGMFQAITADMCTMSSSADIVINTSCEHISQCQYDTWLSLMPAQSVIVLQSNNYDIDEHIRIAESLDEFIQQSNIIVLRSAQLELPLYTRYMIIGFKK